MAEWFYAKRYGYGASLPCSWQGWVVLALFLGLMIGNAVLFEDQPAVFTAITVTIVPIFIVIIWRTTKGGWKWRSGKDKDTL
ncbi:hypothetical protein [Sphingomicrobium clamense]|uniref:Uncharacterized protein n=1 Tax=Sphingomicrobium clamense TaxID=2851013 RepID=A0ABS6V2R0_9SPHN|nr:hypothetical protein [Sphingomicrobium sp. B8]MBW0143845.1 hypothetical protein [Sphingomicrobium sp. B8]